MDAQALHRSFEHSVPLTVGIEEELMLLEADTLELAPRAPELLALLGGDDRFKRELPAAQIELLTPPCVSVAEAARHLRAARRDLAAAARRLGLLVAGAGAHPFSSPLGVMSRGERHGALRAEYGVVAELQLVFGLHIHVAVGGAEAAIAVHDVLRARLPELAALAAAAPYYAGRDSGLASVRPEISGLMPRQGIPPVLGSVAGFAAELAWGAAAGVTDPRRWWWELRPHPLYGTLELRVCDAQPCASGTIALAGVVQALVADLAARHAAGELPPPPASWRIAENRWSACRRGLAGEMCDPYTARREPTAERVGLMLDELRGAARRLGGEGALDDAHALLAAGGEAARQREAGTRRGARGLTAWLAGRFSPGADAGRLIARAPQRTRG